MKRYLDLLQHWRASCCRAPGASTFDTILYKISLVNLPMTDAGFFVVYMAILMFEYFFKSFFLFKQLLSIQNPLYRKTLVQMM